MSVNYQQSKVFCKPNRCNLTADHLGAIDVNASTEGANIELPLCIRIVCHGFYLILYQFYTSIATGCSLLDKNLGRVAVYRLQIAVH